MNNSFWTPFKVGLVFISAVVASIFMVSIVNTDISSGHETYTAYAMFDDATGLALDSKVRLAGVPVGQVTDIRLEGSEVRVEVLMQKRIKLFEGRPIEQSRQARDADGKPLVDTDGKPVNETYTYYKNGASLKKKSASVLGDYYLEVTTGLEGEQVGDGGRIQNVPKVVSFDDLLVQFEGIAGNVEDITQSLADIVASPDGKADLQVILEKLRVITTELSKFLSTNQGPLTNIVANTEGISADVKAITRDSRADLKRILTDVKTVTREVNYIVNQSGGDVQEGLASLKTTLVRFSTTIDELNYALGNVSEITDKVNEGEGSLGVLINDPAIATETEEAITGVNSFLGRLVELKTIVELRSEYYFNQAALKNYVALRLQPRPDKYYLFELVDDTRGSTRLVQETRLQTDPNLPPVVREDRVITTDDFKFSALIAKRWGFFTGKFGLIESTGGIAGELHFFNDDLELRADIFDFDDDVNPRLRVAAAYTFFQYLYIIAGADDVLNDETRDVFLGASLRFNDEDLKALFATGSLPTSF